MVEKGTNFCHLCWKYHRANVFLGGIFLVLAGMMILFFRTKDEEPQLTSAPVICINEGCEQMETNPLTENQNDEIDKAVKKYYQQLAENQDYIEAYENMIVYIKEGQFENTYVVYARYEMKIKDIYTAVPGLGTLYVEKTDSGVMKVYPGVEEKEVQEYIATITQHADVQELFLEVETAYTNAVQSDAMLAEALTDLQEAVQ